MFGARFREMSFAFKPLSMPSCTRRGEVGSRIFGPCLTGEAGTWMGGSVPGRTFSSRVGFCGSIWVFKALDLAIAESRPEGEADDAFVFAFCNFFSLRRACSSCSFSCSVSSSSSSSSSISSVDGPRLAALGEGLGEVRFSMSWYFRRPLGELSRACWGVCGGHRESCPSSLLAVPQELSAREARSYLAAWPNLCFAKTFWRSSLGLGCRYCPSVGAAQTVGSRCRLVA